MKQFLLLVFGISILSLATSCFKDEYDFQNLTVSNYSPYIGLPLINTSFGFNDFLFDVEGNDYLFTDSTDLIYISFTDTVAKIGYSEMMAFLLKERIKISNYSPSQLKILQQIPLLHSKHLPTICRNPKKAYYKVSMGNLPCFLLFPMCLWAKYHFPTTTILKKRSSRRVRFH